MGLIHGGMLSAFLDGLLAAAVAIRDRRGAGDDPSVGRLPRHGPRRRLGVGEARVTRATSELAFVEGRAIARDRDLARASGGVQADAPHGANGLIVAGAPPGVARAHASRR